MRALIIVRLSFAVNQYEGKQLNLTKITRNEMGVYLCIASNGVPPTVSKRIIVDVECEYFFFLFKQTIINIYALLIIKKPFPL